MGSNATYPPFRSAAIGAFAELTLSLGITHVVSVPRHFARGPTLSSPRQTVSEPDASGGHVPSHVLANSHASMDTAVLYVRAVGAITDRTPFQHKELTES
jgi:hypothetical protein